MKTPFTRRKFIQTAAVTSTAALVPSLAGNATGNESVKYVTPEGQLPQKRLGRTNRMVSWLGFGGGSQWCNWQAKDEILQKHIDYAIKLGITYFDTARSYGNGISEERYGKFLTPKYRNQIFLNSKSGSRTYDGVMKDIETTLGLLKTDHLDNYCMHSIDKIEDVDTLLGPEGGYKAFLKLKEQGVVRNIGFSYHKWNDASQKAFKEFDIDIIMCPMNATRSNGNEDNMIPLALKRDLGIIAIKIMGQNVLVGNVTGDDLLRYAMTLPVSVLNVGMDNFPALESCVDVIRRPVISDAEASSIKKKLNFDPAVTKLPYFS
jgi:aryl-alcohol dehydrogenase-like predicted oxidoreductase